MRAAFIQYGFSQNEVIVRLGQSLKILKSLYGVDLTTMHHVKEIACQVAFD